MANYICASRTNYFRVTDLDRLKELARLAGAEVFEETKLVSDGDGMRHEEKSDRIALGGYESFAVAYDEEGEEVDVLAEIQKILAEGEYVVYFESGWEKLRYVSGVVILVTAEVIESMSLVGWAQERIRTLLGDKALDDFQAAY